jgi:hypothetical protein
MIKNKKLELKYSLTWISSSLFLIIIALFPNIIIFLSKILHIKEPVNALFLIIIFFLIVIVFTLTIAVSKNSNRVKVLTQELGILKTKTENTEKNQKGRDEN